MKVGRDLEDDIRRLRIAREVIGPDRYLMIDAKPGLGSLHRHRLGEAAGLCQALLHRGATAPTTLPATAPSPGHRPGEGRHRRDVPDRIIFKQMIAGGAIDIVQIDSCGWAGSNEVLAVLLMAAKYNLPVWPHAGGVGLCEYVQHCR